MQIHWTWIWIQTLALASLKTIFPQSSTFDCYCTKERIVNLGANGGMVVFQKITLPKVKREKKINMKHQSATVQSLCDIGFYNINPTTFSLVIPTSDSLERHWLSDVIITLSVWRIRAALYFKWNRNYIKYKRRKRKGGTTSPFHNPKPPNGAETDILRQKERKSWHPNNLLFSLSLYLTASMSLSCPQSFTISFTLYILPVKLSFQAIKEQKIYL